MCRRRILLVVYHLIRSYREQGAAFFGRLHSVRVTNRLRARLQALGCDVELKPKPAPKNS
jgi:hypothetical protein